MFVGFLNVEQLEETANSLIYQGIREQDDLAVIIKLIKAKYPTAETLHRYRQEYEIINCLEHPGIIKSYDLVRYDNKLAIVLENFAAESLSKLAVETKFTLKEILELSLKINDALNIVHQANIIHKDINPSNILFNRHTGMLKLIDFGIATQIPKEQKSIQNYNTLEGTIAYISPEQTGRMNRSLDYRSDYYSLGATLYQLLTQQLPFNLPDPIGLIHAHLARIPQSPQQIKPEIPQAVSEIVMKLMAKNAEERYQSAAGLKHDLELCLNQLNNHGEIREFELGQKDICDRFIIPEKLYGREREVKILLDSFERVAQGNTELMLVGGFSGIGKTALINEVHKPITKEKGYFIKGKFDQFNRNIPFSAFVQAFSSLIKQLLAESDESSSQWKTKILAALGKNAQVIIDVIGELEIILGVQPAVVQLSGAAAQNRFNLVFSQFVQVFTTQEHPLVIFLDDLQWADSASLNLLQLLMSESSNSSLLVFGAYRDNEVFPAHPLMLTLHEVEQQQTTINRIILKPLTEQGVNNLVADTLLCSEAVTAPLSELIYQKTKGNPFFTTQFLKGLYEDRQIVFRQSENIWQCDLTQVKQLFLTDDVVRFMVSRLQKLPEQTQNVLKLAACIGNHFDLTTLAIICENSEVEVTDNLWSALKAGLIVPETDIYRLFAEDKSQQILPDSVVKYRFLHDRVQQAAYALILEQDKTSIHWNIGQLLLAKLSSEQQKDQLFQLVNQLNLGKKKITSLQHIQNLAELNLQAGTKAKLAGAFQAAYEYFDHGINLLSANFWETHYELTYQLHFNAAETAYLSGDFEQAETLYEISLSNSESVLKQAAIYRLQMTQYQLQGLNLESISIQRKSLKILGWEVPETPEDIELELESQINIVNKFLQNRKINSILNFSLMTDHASQEMLRILQILFYAAWHDGQTNLAFLALAKITTLSLLNGNSEMSPFGYVGYGLLLNAHLEEPSLAYNFGKMAVQLCEQFDNADVKAMTNFLFAADVQSCCKPIKEAETYYKNAYRYGMEAGNWLTVSFMMILSGSDRLTAGKNLNELYKIAQAHGDFMYQVKSLDKLDVLTVGILQPIRNLFGLTQGVDSFDDQNFQEAKFLENYQDEPYHLAWLYSVKIRHAYLFQLQENYLDLIPKLKILEETLPSHTKVPSTVFYVALMYLSLIEKETSEKLSTQYWQNLANLETKIDRWCDNCPANIFHKKLLIQAEKSRLKGHKALAIENYDHAIAQAKKESYIYEEALANELAAKFYFDWGKEKVATVYMQEAYYCYQQWGAKAKTDQLEELYADLLQPIIQAQYSASESLQALSTLSTYINNSTSIPNSEDIFDLHNRIKTAEAITETLELEKLLTQISEIFLQESGCDHVLIALIDNFDRCQVNVCGDTENINVYTDTSEINCDIPRKLFNYIKKTQEVVIINQLDTELPIIDDYLLAHQPKSLLAFPLKQQEQIIGIVYLHSTHTSNIFSSERIVVLEFLGSQVAIALKNAQLHADAQLKSKVIESSVDGVAIFNNGLFTYLNESYLSLFGYESNELVGQSWEKLYPPEEIQCFQQKFFPRLMAKGSLTGEATAIRKDGTKFAQEISLFRLDDGQLICICRNISDRKKSEQSLMESENKFRTLVSNIEGAVYRCQNNADWTMDYISPAIQDLSGYPAEDFIQNTVRAYASIIHPEDIDYVEREVSLAIAKHESFNLEYRLIHYNGSIRWVYEKGKGIYDPEGKLNHIEGAIFDISDRKELEQELKQKEQALTAIVQGTAAKTGADFFRACARYLTDIFKVKYGFVAQYDPAIPMKSKMLALWNGEEFADPYIMDLAGTPCLRTYQVDSYVAYDSLAKLFPQADILAVLEMESYASTVILNSQGEVIGNMGIMDCKPLSKNNANIDFVLQLFATRVGAEMERQVNEDALKKSQTQLQTINEELEKRVEERTYALAQINQDLELAKNKADAANKAKSIFLANMSHELRTPLNGILGYAQILRRNSSLTTQQNKGLNIIHNSGNHLLNLINEILDHAKIEAGKLELLSQDFHLLNCIQSIVDIITPQAKAKELNFIFEADVNLPNGIFTDEKRLRQILLNLLSNAIKFTDRGEVKLTVKLIDTKTLQPDAEKLSKSENYQTIHFAVKDSGIGMDSDQLARIFNPFEQVGEWKRQAAGTGLGLNITKQLIEMMGGTLEVSSQVNQGSTFWFEAQYITIDKEISLKSSIETNNILGYQGQVQTILLIDDQRENLVILETMLESLGFKTIVVTNGQEGIDIAKKSPPQCIITDILMPVKDGIDTVSEIRNSPELDKIPVFAISTDESFQKEADSVGCDEFLTRPIEEEQLVTLLQNHLQIEWILDSTQTQNEAANIEGISANNVLPDLPAKEIEKLYELAMLGSMKKIKEQANHLEKLDDDYVDLARQLRQLADSFQEKAIFELIEKIHANH